MIKVDVKCTLFLMFKNGEVLKVTPEDTEVLTYNEDEVLYIRKVKK